MTPTLLLILDGWGIAPAGEGNAISLANTPNLDRLVADYPTSRLACSGRAVGLPEGFMGNSEVGHMNIGAGRVVYQDMTLIDVALEENKFQKNLVLNDVMTSAKAKGGTVHLMGLVSDGGVHSHIRHLIALIEMAKAVAVDVCVHVFLDGRDTSPTSGLDFVKQLQSAIERIGAGRIASISGRYYAMDRDKRWDRNQLAWDCFVHGKGNVATDPLKVIQESYDNDITDEFFVPTSIIEEGGEPTSIKDGDSVFMFNFRADRMRQIAQAMCSEDFAEFNRGEFPKLSALASMTSYEKSFGLPVAFAKDDCPDPLGEIVAKQGVKQLRIAETEKYAHVTYFFNCGREEPFENEDRELISSPRDVATYDLKPQMSVEEVTDKLVTAINSKEYSMIVCNFANLDMVGHTGIIDAAIKACEAVDTCVGKVLDAVRMSGGRALVTADHGNAEELRNAEGKTHTAHTTNPVPLVVFDENKAWELREEGILGDIAPTILDMWDIEQPAAMNGKSLISKD
ncbi:2,3-bisphosphoglycerate-independent phosphoglycerate mutase [Halodesulfovibrio sp.]|jgi:2,3-bisphosphoglycerate-independent phosphoglycerate mutase|uniref:2,3-bisphosphoglycerate-independent phosphoglycerate mutase n=1 Tax=Halodesulfovibrio sp. TaxID=1912772 RepID=UPI0025E67454|nr:2,3-bisphosphoglycerate-independent phosphoglycerate mutase [Halodesulfovibrio sp.]MCT4534942.1 2,3-bisphosphoglycerate-independent phosphoglycerate mutase [Halodesulfovibrio sp.]MCT4627745.1 2,3-bisphosphoglycerate-independent phosphoglycerate mutase [Halodesulfovibrio sp.]